MGATVSNIASGFIAEKFGWNGTLIFYLISATIGFSLFLVTWNKKPKVLENQE
jgi:MFS transporter, OPA family, glycerol-3-phosphate transporter